MKIAKQSKTLAWNDSLAVGVAEMDEQHMILVHTLGEAAARPVGDWNADVLEQVTRDLLAYALYHFETEERLMDQYGYRQARPEEADVHLADHRAFSAKVVATRERIKAGEKVAPADVIEFLNNWLVGHIQNIDRKLGVFVAAKRLEGGRAAGAPVG